MISKELLLQATKCNAKNLDIHYKSIIEAMEKYNIDSSKRVAAFLANVMHETGGLKSFEENLKYSESGLLATFKSRVTPEEAKFLAKRPELIANKVYGGRYGNTAPEDGWKYRGRGIFQVTFKDNYEKIGKLLKVDLVNNPDLLTKEPYAALSAGAFWNSNNLNSLADKEDMKAITKKINGGTNGLEDRIHYYDLILTALNELT